MEPNLKVSLIQTDISWENVAINLKNLETKIETIQDTDIIILPEMFTTGFTMSNSKCAETMDGRTIQWMQSMATSKNCVITGSLIIHENDKYFNRLIWATPDGTIQYYDKKHLFSLSFENENYSAGAARKVFQYKGWNILVLICYDIRFQNYCANAGIINNNYRGEYDLAIVVASWPERRSMAWNALIQARAIENQCYLVAVNRVGADGNDVMHKGDSSVIHPNGEILFKKENDETIYQCALQVDELVLHRRTYQFWKDASICITNN